MSTNGGTASRVFSGVKAGTYTLTETTMPLKTKRTLMQCGGVAQNGSSMTLEMVAGRPLACSIAHAADQEQIQRVVQCEVRSFVSRRASTLSTVTPDRTRLFGRLTGSLFGEQPGNEIGTSAGFGETGQLSTGARSGLGTLSAGSSLFSARGGAPLETLNDGGWGNLAGDRIGVSHGNPSAAARMASSDGEPSRLGAGGVRPFDVGGNFEEGSGQLHGCHQLRTVHAGGAGERGSQTV